MRAALSPILSLVLVVGLTACAERGISRPEGTPQGLTAPTSTGPASAAPAKVAPPPAPDAGAEEVMVPSPPAPADEPAPAARSGPSEQDVADCYRFAQATVDHDRRIERDRGSSIGFGSLGSDVGSMTRKLDDVGEGSTFDRAYASCMRRKGY